MAHFGDSDRVGNCQCRADARDQRCGNLAMNGQEVCRFHGGAPKAAISRRSFVRSRPTALPAPAQALMDDGVMMPKTDTNVIVAMMSD